MKGKDGRLEKWSIIGKEEYRIQETEESIR
jgi:hypothetical protein